MANSSLIDSRTGIIRRLERRPIPDRFPRSYQFISSGISDTRQFSPWASDSGGAGYGFFGEEAAIGAAIGEAVERYCGHLVSRDLQRGSYEKLLASGFDLIDPASLALFSAEQHEDPMFPMVPFTRDLEVDWVEGTDLLTGSSVMMPAGLVWVTYFDGGDGALMPRTNPIIQAGLAAGQGRRSAELSAVMEVIERDAMTMAWWGRKTLARVQVPDWLTRLGKGPRDILQTDFYVFPNDFEVNVIGCGSLGVS